MVLSVGVAPPSVPPLGTSHVWVDGSLHVRLAGCVETGPGPSCALSPDARQLVVTVEDAAARQVHVTLDGLPVRDEPQRVADGELRIIRVPPSARSLEVGSIRSGGGQLVLKLETLQSPPFVSTVLFREGEEAWNDGDIDAAREIWALGVQVARDQGLYASASQKALTIAYDEIRNHEFESAEKWLTLDAEIQPFVNPNRLYYRALLNEYLGRRDEAIAAYGQVREFGVELGMPLDTMLGAHSQYVLSLAWLGNHDDVVEEIHAGLAEAPGLEPTNYALFLNTVAWALLVSWDRIGAPLSQDPELDPRALLLDARALFLAHPATDDGRYTNLLNLAYEALLRRDAADARRWLVELESMWMFDQWAGPWRQAYGMGAVVELWIWICAAYRETSRGDPDIVRRRLRSQAEVMLPRHSDDAWRRLLWARVDRMEGAHPSARWRLEGMLEDSEANQDYESLWLSRVELARVLEDQGFESLALAQYERAEEVLDEQLPFLGLSDRSHFALEHDDAARGRVELLLSRGQVDQALCVARLTRTRVMRMLYLKNHEALGQVRNERIRLYAQYDLSHGMSGKDRDREQRRIGRALEDNLEQMLALLRDQVRSIGSASCESLSAPPRGVIDLHYMQLRDHWVGFAVAQGARGDIEIRARRLDPLPDQADDEVLSSILLDPFIEFIDGAARVRVIPRGSLHSVPFHALPFGSPGQRLQDVVEVVYGLDLPGASWQLDVPDEPSRGLTLSPSNLPMAPAEADRSQEAFWRFGAEPLRLEQKPQDRVRLEQVLHDLPRVSWLHFVGHARSSAAGGFDSALELGYDESVDVPNILSLRSVPDTVVLSGCRTGVFDPQALEGGLSLVHAFMLRGAQVVVATTEKVDDVQSQDLMEDFYMGLEALVPGAVPVAMRRAQRRAAEREEANPEEAAWRLVRTWVP